MRSRAPIFLMMLAACTSAPAPVDVGCPTVTSSLPPSQVKPDGGTGHVHPEEPTPEAYLARRNPYGYSDRSLAALGAATYGAQCARCHGNDGRGCGPEASKYLPRPADLLDANLDHDDPYLYWRIDVGGHLPGFQTDMPGFGQTLSDDDIWRVITYVRWTFSE